MKTKEQGGRELESQVVQLDVQSRDCFILFQYFSQILGHIYTIMGSIQFRKNNDNEEKIGNNYNFRIKIFE